jgi:hypothetical protein
MYAALKITTVMFFTIAAAIVAMDPTVKVAMIVATPGMITGIGTIILALMNRKTQQEGLKIQIETKANVDGNFSKLWEEKDRQVAQLKETQDKLSHAEGYRAGSESERKP